MPRPLRIHLPDLVFHVLNRGNNRQLIFVGDEDKQRYLDILKKYKEKFNFKIFAYCLMTNHIHLLLRTAQQGTISNIMKAITIAHTKHYHHKYNTSGHVWEGRFKSPIVSDDEYLLTLMRYIEQNPVRARIVSCPQEYPFSSCRANISIEKDSLVDKEENPVFMELGNLLSERVERYKNFAISLLEEEKLKLIRKSLGGQTHFTSEKFLKQIKEKLAMIKKKPRGRPRKTLIYP